MKRPSRAAAAGFVYCMHGLSETYRTPLPAHRGKKEARPPPRFTQLKKPCRRLSKRLSRRLHRGGETGSPKMLKEGNRERFPSFSLVGRWMKKVSCLLQV